MANASRPRFFNLLQIRLPAAGVVSILHRLSGAVLALAIPAAIGLLALSLSGPEGFAHSRALWQTTGGQVALFCVLWAFLHHLLAGLRFLLIDVGVGVERPRHRLGAHLVLYLASLFAYLLALRLLGQAFPGDALSRLLGLLP